MEIVTTKSEASPELYYNLFLGEIKIIDINFPDVVMASSYWKACDGSYINDNESILNGRRIRNYNNGSIVFDVTFTPNAGGATANISENDITGLNIGDVVSGTGIAGGSTITAINATSITISDIAATGLITTTFTSDIAKTNNIKYYMKIK